MSEFKDVSGLEALNCLLQGQHVNISYYEGDELVSEVIKTPEEFYYDPKVAYTVVLRKLGVGDVVYLPVEQVYCVLIADTNISLLNLADYSIFKDPLDVVNIRKKYTLDEVEELFDTKIRITNKKVEMIDE